jgi:hypothetical protein
MHGAAVLATVLAGYLHWLGLRRIRAFNEFLTHGSR